MEKLPSLAAVRAHLRRVWGDDPNVQRACNAIVDYLIERASVADFITLGDFASRATEGVKESSLLQAARYLASDKIPLLEFRFQYIDRDREDEVSASRDIYTASDIERFDREGFVDPNTGTPVAGYRQNMYLFFEPTHLARSLGKRARQR